MRCGTDRLMLQILQTPELDSWDTRGPRKVRKGQNDKDGLEEAKRGPRNERLGEGRATYIFENMDTPAVTLTDGMIGSNMDER